MSHELRTPLNAIIGFSEIMETSMFGPLGSDKYGEYCRDIHQSGQYLLEVINDILDMSKIEAGHLRHHPRLNGRRPFPHRPVRGGPRPCNHKPLKLTAPPPPRPPLAP